MDNKFKPYVSPETNMLEFTPRAIIIGLFMAVILTKNCIDYLLHYIFYSTKIIHNNTYLKIFVFKYILFF